MNLANKLTVGRLLMALVFFAAMVATDHSLPGLEDPMLRRRWLFNITFVLFVIAGLTDIADGWVARRYNMTSDFGRVADPFCDKVMTCGSFIFLTTLPIVPGGERAFVPAWIAVLIVAREFLVTGLRGFLESRGQAFGAMVSGKLKMFVQCFTIGSALYTMANLHETRWALNLTHSCVWASLVITLVSGITYVTAAKRLLSETPTA